MMSNIEEILQAIRKLPPADRARIERTLAEERPEPVDPADPRGDEAFERAAEYVLRKNAELYRRLA